MNIATATLLAIVGMSACFIAAVQVRNNRRTMRAIESLTESVSKLGTSIAALTTSVDAAVAEINTEDATEAQLNTLAGVVDALKTNVDAQATRLNEAVNSTPVIPVEINPPA